MKKVLILQNVVPHYRKPVYNELSRYYDVTILHSGDKSLTSTDAFKEIIEPSTKIGSFILQPPVLSVLRRETYDVVIVMFDLHWVCNIIAAFLPRKSRLIWWGHRYTKHIIIDKLKDILILRSDGVVLYGESEIGRLVSRGISSSKIFVAPNTIHIPNHSDGSFYNGKDSFLFTGRAQKRKKVDILIKAFSEVIERIPANIKINIVGSGQENEKLIALAEKHGVLSRVVFHGELFDQEKLKKLFHKSFAYVSPGPVGLGVLHSLAYGVPVVTASWGKHGPEFENLINNENALIYNTYDEFKQILVDLCNQKGLSSYLGNNAYKKYFHERTLEKMVSGFRKAIEGI